jgi:NtrC-family two-component system sensor histidine kinase KinB
MKLSIRTKFTFAMIILFLIILVLTVFSGYYLNRMSGKTSAILKENYLSIVYAREMSEGIMNINQEISSCYLTNRNPDTLKIRKELSLIDISLESEKNNITSPGEDKLVLVIETDYSELRNNIIKSMSLPESSGNILDLQNKSENLFQQLMLLSQMNGKSIEVKTNDAKIYAKKASVQMSIIGTVCFIIALSLTFNYGSYFNERFHQLHKGIKELASSNYGQRLYFDEGDEFSEIALVFNRMAEKLSENKSIIPPSVKPESEKEIIVHDVKELKDVLARIKTIEEQVSGLISKLTTK